MFMYSIMYETFYYLKSFITENCTYYYNRFKSKYHVFYFNYIHNSSCNPNNLLQF